ncbi:hypothetical protein AOB54_06525 [beta proteobacterium MWH-UniP1]
MSQETLLVTLEALLIGGGALAFGLWQLHSVKKDQEKTREEKTRQPSQAERDQP